MDNYALGYNERSSRSTTLGTRHLHYTRSKAQSPVTRELPLLASINNGESKESTKDKEPSPKESKETSSEIPIEDSAKGTVATEDTQKSNQE